ncbi:MAG: GEVED domain-containing protein [Salibacteraceae bacterium]|nr:GEVED domain-containing protein [Salibacteraceae bacterium]
MKNTYSFRFSGLFNIAKLFLVLAILGSSNVEGQTTYTVGTGTAATTQTANTPFGSYYHDNRTVYLYSAADLAATGASAGIINSVGFNVASLGGQSLNGLNVKIGFTSATSVSGFPTSGMTTVYTATSYTPTTGWNTFTFSGGQTWNGSDNVLVEVCFDNSSYTSNYSVYYTTTTANTVYGEYSDSGFGASCSATGAYTFDLAPTARPNAQFSITSGPCSNPVNGGITVASDTLTCPANMVQLSLSGASTGLGMTFQWEQSTNGTTWTSITGATNAAYNTTVSTPTYFRCVIACSGGTSATSTQVFVDVDNFLACYCPANSSYGTSGGFYGPINNVTFNTLNNSSSYPFSSPYYTNYAPAGNTTTTVFTGFSYTFSLETKYAYSGVWIDWDQNGSYDAAEYVYVGYSSTNAFQTYTVTIPVPLTAVPGQTGMRVRTEAYFYSMNSGNACTQFYYGETEDYIITVANPPTDDAGIAAINTPSFPACTLDSNICVTIQNFGTDTLFSCDISYAVNNGSYTTYNWTGMIPPQSDDTVCTQIGTATFNIGDDLTVVASNANGTGASTYLANDSMFVTDMNVSLQGVYGIPADYSTINDAIDAMNTYGVCDHVVFNIASGTYTEHMQLENVAGMGPNATVTFKSATNDTADVIVEFEGNFDTNNVVRMNNASWFRFKNITFQNTAAFYGRVFEIGGQSTNNVIDSNRLIGTVINSTSTNYAVIYSVGSKDNMNTYSNNSIENGSYGLYLRGDGNTNGSHEVGTKVINNAVINSYYMGMYLYYQQGIEVMENVVTSNSLYTFGYGVYCYDCDNGMDISYNHIYADSGSLWPYYGLYTGFSEGSGQGLSYVTNNIVSVNNAAAAFYQYYSDLMYVYNNTFTVMSGSTTTTRAYYAYYSDFYFTKNNLISNFGAGQAAGYYYGTPFEVNTNSYFANSTDVFYYNGQYLSSLAAFQNASNLDMNALYVNPNFGDTIAGIVCNDSLDGAGESLAIVTDDFTHLARATTPDIGAREFVSLANFDLGSDTICGTSFEVFGPVSNASWTVNSVASTGNSVMLSTGTTPSTFNVNISFSSVCSVDTNGNQIPVTDAGTFRLIPAAELASTLHLCADDVATLSPGGGANATYLWFPTNETSSAIQINGGGIYSVTKDEEGCMSQATIAVSESDGVDLQNAEVCAGDLPYQVDATIVGGQSYSWSEGSSTATVDLNTTGVYFVTVTDNQGCSSSDSIFFEAIDIPTVGFTETHSGYVYYFNSGSSANAGSSASYAWSFGDGSAISTDANPTHQYPWASPSTPAVYITTLTITNACGTNNKSMEIMPDPVGINELGNSISYNVYPNPSNGFVNVEFTGTVAEQASLRVMDISGRLVSESSANTNDIVTLNLSSVASGTYILEVSIDGAVSQTRISIQ